MQSFCTVWPCNRHAPPRTHLNITISFHMVDSIRVSSASWVSNIEHVAQRFSRVSSRPRNGWGMRQNSSPRLVLDHEKQGSKVSSLKWLRKGQNSDEFLVLSSKRPRKREKFLASSRPRPRKNYTKGLVLDLVLARWPLENLCFETSID